MPRPLTQTRALHLARKAFGETAYVRRLPQVWTAEDRELAREALRLHRQQEPTMVPLKDWPADATVGAYREALVQYTAEAREWKRRERELIGLAMRYRYSVGTKGNLYSLTKGQGDTWEQALADAGVLPSPEAVNLAQVAATATESGDG